MYSGTTFTKYSGRILGTHQKFDRLARADLIRLMPSPVLFPPIRQILQFEGKNGPDGIKRKSPSRDEPVHFYNPFNEDDTGLLVIITEHYNNLVTQLKKGNQERAAFEAAWLAHAIVDGMTPAHHYPYEERLSELRGGEGNETRSSLRGKLIMPGTTTREMLKNNWKMWGPNGLYTTHGLFELGIATLVAPLTVPEALPTMEEIETFEAIGFLESFKRAAREVAALDMYDQFQQKGWTQKLANQVRHTLAPTIVKTLTLTWYMAVLEAGLVTKKAAHETYRRKLRR